MKNKQMKNCKTCTKELVFRQSNINEQKKDFKGRRYCNKTCMANRYRPHEKTAKEIHIRAVNTKKALIKCRAELGLIIQKALGQTIMGAQCQ